MVEDTVTSKQLTPFRDVHNSNFKFSRSLSDEGKTPDLCRRGLLSCCRAVAVSTDVTLDKRNHNLRNTLQFPSRGHLQGVRFPSN